MKDSIKAIMTAEAPLHGFTHSEWVGMYRAYYLLLEKELGEEEAQKFMKQFLPERS